MKKLIILLVVCLIPQVSFALSSWTEARKLAWMRKMSLVLIGADADDQDKQSGLEAPDWLEFQIRLVQRYQKKYYYADKMATQIFRHLGIAASSDRYVLENYRSSGQFVGQILIQNQPWHTLFDAQGAWVNPTSSESSQFYRRIFGTRIPVSDWTFPKHVNDARDFIYMPAVTEQERQVLAGVITTPDFMNERYFTTSTNHNFKRAAALYRLTMCNNMQPVIISDIAFEQELLLQSISNATASVLATNDQHGSDPQCTGCHKFLGPGSKLFQTSQVTPAGRPVKTMFVGADSTQTVFGLNEWLKAALATKEGRLCQVQFFWDLIIGKNVPVSEPELMDLSEKFERSNENFNQMVADLVLRDEFSATPAELETRPVTLNNVKGILHSCDSCHQRPETEMHSKMGGNPWLSRFPIGGSEQLHNIWIAQIADVLDLDHQGQRATMPPPRSEGRLTNLEMLMLAKFIGDGAKNDEGKRTISQPILATQNVSLGIEKAGFDWNFRRYLSGGEILHVLERLVKGGVTDLSKCLDAPQKSVGGYSYIGDFSPYTFTPFLDKPNDDYYNYINQCLITSTLEFLRVKKGMLVGHLSDSATHLEWIDMALDLIFGPHGLTSERRHQLKAQIFTNVEKRRVTSDTNYMKYILTGLFSAPDFLIF